MKEQIVNPGGLQALSEQIGTLNSNIEKRVYCDYTEAFTVGVNESATYTLQNGGKYILVLYSGADDLSGIIVIGVTSNGFVAPTIINTMPHVSISKQTREITITNIGSSSFILVPMSLRGSITKE